MSESQEQKSTDIRDILRETVEHLAHVLPAQAPIQDFVHHNTLHGFQHLPFTEALAKARKVNDAYAYLSAAQFREYFQQGRITQADLETVLADEVELQSGEPIVDSDTLHIERKDIYLEGLLHPLMPVTAAQLTWQIEERHALQRFQDDVSPAARRQLLQAAGLASEAEAVSDLWAGCLEALGLVHFILHPEELLDLGQEHAERIFNSLIADEDEVDDQQLMVHRMVRKEAEHTLHELMEQVGPSITLSGLLRKLVGVDLLDDIRPLVIRHISNYLDQGLAAWHHRDRTQGFFSAWRDSALHDLAWSLAELEWVQDELTVLPDDSLEVVIGELQRLGLSRSRWPQYIERVCMELPGWSGMFLWRHQHPGFEGLQPEQVQMMDYIAMRLVLERFFAQRLCNEHWQLEPRLDVLHAYFRRHRSEFVVRYLLQLGRLPEYLVTQAQRLLNRSALHTHNYQEWVILADRVWTWRHSPAADRPLGYSIYRSAWRLFRLAQHLGLCAAQVRQLEKPHIDLIFSCLDKLDDERSGYLWLQAYETHYREQLLNALASNVGRGRWQSREQRPTAQIVFCMDDREEGFRRHLEELNPTIETLGAAGFFGVAINWRGLDDETVAPLCPIVVKPAHEVREQVVSGQEELHQQHNARRATRLRTKNFLLQELRRNPLTAAIVVTLGMPLYALTLLGKIIAPQYLGTLAEKLRRQMDLTVPTSVAVNAVDITTEASAEHPRLGFTDKEQVDRVENFLRTIGLTTNLGNLVVLMGHGSSSQNNPHLSAYDCGACSGRHGGPNARVFAALANRPEVRKGLAERGIEITPSTWFLGAEHNTCDETITWYDTEQIPQARRDAFAGLQGQLLQASLRSAHERCRRFASAPRAPSLRRALQHVVHRAYDFSQARAELGHATNAAAYIGRRSASQGLFLDRRVFLISYDPTQDPSGKIVEAILLAAGPVGAGINLEYYFSTVNNQRYGCGSKVTHNVVGLFGIMEGASSDLRTGLPQQMIEIHEAMRLQVIVEASVEVLTEIYQRQPVIQELVGNAWIHLIAQDPVSKNLSVFKPGAGFVHWQGKGSEPPRVKTSSDWYAGHSGPLPFALIDGAADV